MNIDDLTLRKIKEIKALVGTKESSGHLSDPAGKWQVAILERGWVVVGKTYQSDAEITIKDGSVVRIWGTTKGLGELATNGPLSSTKLDPIPTLRVHESRVVALIDCGAAWK